MKRKGESGFAMLLVFLMAASIAIMLYMQLPRAAFEAQRAKEEMLQERGEQYIRAIQLYVAKWRSYPPSMDSLEKTNGVRYLRRRYKDPLTGKDEWRLIHVNAAGQLVDSLIKKKEEEKKPNLNNFITEAPTIGSTGPNTETTQNAALRRRPSDQNPALGAGAANVPLDPASLGNGAQIVNPGVPPNGQPDQQGQVSQPGQVVQQGQIQPGQPMQGGEASFANQPGPGTVPAQINQPGQVTQPGQPNQQQNQQQFGQQQFGQQQFGQQPFGQQQQPAQHAQPTQPASPGLPYPVPTPPGAGGFANQTTSPTTQAGQPGQPTGQNAGQNQGLDMINKILTTPRSQMNMGVQELPDCKSGEVLPELPAYSKALLSRSTTNARSTRNGSSCTT